MALRLEDKKALVTEVNEVALRAHSVVAAEYRGLTVAQLTDLRAKARASRVYMRVVKNTLARRAVAGTQFECVGDKLKGPLILAFSEDDPGAAARLMRGFAKDHQKLVPATVALLWGRVSAPFLPHHASAGQACRPLRAFPVWGPPVPPPPREFLFGRRSAFRPPPPARPSWSAPAPAGRRRTQSDTRSRCEAA